jgi:hypothetical protein
MVDFNEKIYKCSNCIHFREKTASDFGMICPVHGSVLRQVGTLRDLYRLEPYNEQ